MRITLLVNRDIASNLALNYLLPSLAHHNLSVFLSSRVGNVTNMPPALQDLMFMEQRLFNDIVFPLLRHSEDARREDALKSFEELNQYLDQPMALIDSVNCAQGLSRLRATQPDLVVSIRFGLILKEEAIAIPKFGVINLHSGLLPYYKGVMATFRAMLNDEPEIGTTLHFINNGDIDVGDIIDTSVVRVEKHHSYLWHVLRLYQGGCKLVLNAVDAFDRDESVVSTPQAEAGNYFTFPRQDELDRFYEKGFRLFDGGELVDFAKQFFPEESSR